VFEIQHSQVPLNLKTAQVFEVAKLFEIYKKQWSISYSNLYHENLSKICKILNSFYWYLIVCMHICVSDQIERGRLGFVLLWHLFLEITVNVVWLSFRLNYCWFRGHIFHLLGYLQEISFNLWFDVLERIVSRWTKWSQTHIHTHLRHSLHLSWGIRLYLGVEAHSSEASEVHADITLCLRTAQIVKIKGTCVCCLFFDLLRFGLSRSY